MTRFTMTLTTALATMMTLATPGWSDGRAFFVGNADYGFLSFLGRPADMQQNADTLAAQGISVTSVQDANAAQMRRAFTEFVDGIDEDTSQVAIILAGRFAAGAGGAYLLPVDAEDPLDPAQVLMQAFPLDAALAILAQYPGRAVLALAEGDVSAQNSGPVSAGAGEFTIPQGVTVIRGELSDVSRFVGGVVAAPDADLIRAARRADLTVEGFAPQTLSLFDQPEQVQAQPPARNDGKDDDDWARALSANSEQAYQDYLDRHPSGAHAADARQRLASLRETPFYREKTAEENLNLSRDARREIQRNLSLLGHDTRGIDGIFGRGSRAAITAWQKANGLTESGYLNAQHISRLAQQARLRAAELEEEARLRQIEQDKRDRAFWQETGAAGDAAGLRAYLERFPDGIYADLAQERLKVIEDRERAQAVAQDREAWDRARSRNDLQAYRTYLSQYPKGAFADQAKARIADLSVSDADKARIEQAQAAERGLGLNKSARQLIESRLKSLGLKPGKIDGKFDDATRRAIRRYQDARQLPVTGYINQTTFIRLMADSILR
ncbi:peptidoglycan-binding domain-containing protein [Aliiroseovarius crassostreae]|uniref:peptidoglycan-binding domain-containing protein n=1 Tax=Aliiroseovarius crassostreae TaxID=154981 RepID=UPI0021FB1507|nr:peptidoglycan-binding protein [Aliiroseovarius crassostreae]UWP89210.1 peptidoglycan-binding protein [Aliiroseovarius crassostreae]